MSSSSLEEIFSDFYSVNEESKQIECQTKNLSVLPELMLELISRSSIPYTYEAKRNHFAIIRKQIQTRNSGEFLQCSVCGYYSTGELTAHLRYEHGMKPNEYSVSFGVPYISEKSAKEKSERVKGEKNPAFNHGGKFSPFSRKFVKYKDDDSYEKGFQSVVQAAKESADKNNSYNTTIEFYTARGMTLAEAERARRKRQKTFVLSDLIAKHGKEEGTRIYEKRQEKWLKTLADKPEEEKIRINSMRLKGLGYHASKPESYIAERLEEAGFQVEKQFRLIKSKANHYVFDIKVGNFIIEFNGDYWHANPSQYAPDTLIKYPGDRLIPAKDIWERDRKKNSEAERSGYTVISIWETDFNEDKIGTVQWIISQIK